MQKYRAKALRSPYVPERAPSRGRRPMPGAWLDAGATPQLNTVSSEPAAAMVTSANLPAAFAANGRTWPACGNARRYRKQHPSAKSGDRNDDGVRRLANGAFGSSAQCGAGELATSAVARWQAR